MSDQQQVSTLNHLTNSALKRLKSMRQPLMKWLALAASRRNQMQRSQKQLTSTKPSEMTFPMDQRISQLSLHNKIDYLHNMNQMPTTQL